MLKWLKRFFKTSYTAYEIVPWYKGYVRYNVVRNTNIVAPLPFNLIAGFVYLVWQHCKLGFRDIQRFQRQQEALRDQIDVDKL